MEEIQKSAEEQLADVITEKNAEVVAQVEEIKSALDGIEIPSVEGFVTEEKAAELIAVAKTEAQEAAAEFVKNELANLPAPAIAKEANVQEFTFKYDESNFHVPVQKSLDIVKAELTPNNAADAPVGSTSVWAEIVEMNPFRSIANVFPVTSASFKTFELTSIDAHKNENAGSQTEGGAVANDTVNVNDYNSLTRINENLVDDLPGLDSMVGMEQSRYVMLEEHKDIITVLDGATITEVSADISEGDLSNLSTYQSLIASLPNSNWSAASWVMSSNAYTELLNANHSGTGSPHTLKIHSQQVM